MVVFPESTEGRAQIQGKQSAGQSSPACAGWPQVRPCVALERGHLLHRELRAPGGARAEVVARGHRPPVCSAGPAREPCGLRVARELGTSRNLSNLNTIYL